MTVRLLLPLSAIALLASCGDDLESRQAAVQERMPERDLSIQSSPKEARDSSTPIPTAPAEGFANDSDAGDENAGNMEDAAPDELIDNAQGFSTDPIDDTSGFDPSPDAPQGFAPEPIGPESFGE